MQKPLLRQNITTSQQPNLIDVTGQWTNNNCESLNHVLKQATDWRTQRIPQLIETLYTIVQGQHKDLERSIIGRGDYRLCDDYRQFSVTPDVWASRTAQQRHLLRFMKKPKEADPRFVRATDGPE